MSTSPTLPDVPVPNDDGFTEIQIDADCIAYCFTTLLELYGPTGAADPSTVSAQEFESHALVRSLTDEGITSFSELIALGGDAITRLQQAPQLVTKNAFNNVTRVMETIQTLAPAGALEGRWTRRTRALIAYYHHQSCINNQSIEIQTVHPGHFGSFRVNTYIPDDPTTPWNRETNYSASSLTTWGKDIKPNKSDYKDFKDEAIWSKHKQHFLNTLESQNLLHLAEFDYKVSDPILDQQQ